jgi:hypothetical protein
MSKNSINATLVCFKEWLAAYRKRNPKAPKYTEEQIKEYKRQNTYK